MTLTPLDDRGTAILDELETDAPPPFRWDLKTGARPYWQRPGGAGGWLRGRARRLTPGWREHLARTP
jgi:hypothetical protein